VSKLIRRFNNEDVLQFSIERLKMKINNIKSFIFKKWFFPKIIKINKPGVIITKGVKKYGKSTSINRPAFIFENSLSDLQTETVKKIGKEKTLDLWYKIGKDIIFSYFLVSKAKKPPKIFLQEILEYIISRIVISGMTLGTDINFDKKDFSLVLRGENNIICRKSGIGSVHSGLISGIMSFLTGENIEAEKTKCCYDEDYCEIISNKKIPEKYIVDIERIENFVKNYYLVMPDSRFENIALKYSDLATFDKFLKFGSIEIKNNITYFEGEELISGEINTADHIVYNYKKLGLDALLEKSLIKTAEKTIGEIFKTKNLDEKEKLKFLINMMSAFGWGIPVYKREKERIIFDFIYGAQAKTNTFYVYALQLNGFLNYIFNKKFKIKEIKMSLERYPVSKVVYE
jgi:hypothetical protein